MLTILQNRYTTEAVATNLFFDLLLFMSMRQKHPSSEWHAKPQKRLTLYGPHLLEDTAVFTVDKLTKL
jgi:hypothetical protein